MKLKTVISLEKLRVFKIKSHLSVSTRKEPQKKLKLLKYTSTLTIFLIMQNMNMVTSNNGKILKGKFLRVMAMTLNFSD